MPQVKQAGEFNTFVGGLVTEASPLTFPENASIDEANFVLNRDGSRQRRLGMEREEGVGTHNISYATAPAGDIRVNLFEWNNVAGIAGKSFIVCQVHDEILIMDRADETLKSSAYVKQRYFVSMGQVSKRASFTAIDGKLIIAYGQPTIRIITYTPADNGTPDSFSFEDRGIKIRDLFGVEDIFEETIGSTVYNRDLLSPEFINYRPTEAGEEHHYNLRNQGWAVPRLVWNDKYKWDTIYEFIDSSGNPDANGNPQKPYPSNADTPVVALYPNTDNVDDKVSERFNEVTSWATEPARSRAATGYFIIDLFDRGSSRMTEYNQACDVLRGTYKEANLGSGSVTWPLDFVGFSQGVLSNLPSDITEGGVNLVSEFAGRVWYAGFSSTVTDGDSQSPNLSSYLFYSQQVRHDSQITKCYQEGDPTDVVAPDLLDTDGGFVRLSGAYNIQALVNIGTGLMVFAENGIWFVGGSDRGSFNANNQSVDKISEIGTVSPGSIVVVESTIMYWANDAIYHLKPNENGLWSTSSLSDKIITYYQNITDGYKRLANGIYDDNEKQVRWVYQNDTTEVETKELVFDLILGSFYPSVIGAAYTSQIPAIPLLISPYKYTAIDVPVYSASDKVLSDTDVVVYPTEGVVGGFKTITYLTLINSEFTDDTSISFSSYSNEDFKDWGETDAPAYLLTGYIGTGDNQRYKQVPYIYFHLLRTETGFTDSNDDFIVQNESSCKVQAQWDWANSANYGKWGKEFQAYRYKRLYIPEDSSDTYDSGQRTIVSKNKLRGRGRVVSFLISTEEDKDMQLLGWSMNIASNQSV